MRSCKFVLNVAVMAGLLSACAASGPASAPRQTSGFQSKVGQAVNWDDDEIVDYVTELTKAQLTVACRTVRGYNAQMDCVRAAVYQGFDTSGQARENCDLIRDLGEFFECVVMGSMIHDIIARTAPEQLANFDWRAPETRLDGMADGIKNVLLGECLEGDLAEVDSCYLDKIAASFALPPEHAALCSDFPRTDDAAECMLRVYFVHHFEASLRRLGQGAGRSV